MERPGVPGHLWVLLLIPIALWLTPPVSGLTSTKSVSPTTTVTQLSSSLSSTITTTMTSSKTTATSTTIPTTPTTPTTTTTTLSTTAAPVVPGKDCDKETPSPPCVSNAFCNDTKMCQCNSTHYEDASNNTCRERKPYAGECSQSSECQTVNNQDCVPDDKNQKRCLCMQDYFRLTECKNKNILTITPSRPGQAQENSINVTWTNPTGPNGASLEYKATSTDPNGTIVPSSWSADPHYYFMNVTQGTVYIISVTAKTQSNPGYGNGTVEHKGPDANIYTKPAQPGSLLSANSEGGNVTVEFTSSAGRVERYTVIVTKDGTTTNASSVTVAMTKVSAFFVGLTPGEHYNVTMTAFSGNIPSKSRTDRFRVSAQQAGKVSGGKLISNGSRWVQISWTKPSKPNGEIMGYTVQLRSDNGSCSSGVAVRCDACNYNSTKVTPEVNECNRKDQINEPISNLGSNSYVVSVNVTDLMPYTNYTYTIAAYNEEGAGMPFSGHTFVTLSEAAANLKNLDITAPSKGVLSISLKPGERRGKTTYIITLEEEESIDRGDYTLLNVTVLEGYENTSTDIDNLLSYWNYRVTVATNTTIGFSPDNTTVDARTRESEPGQVQGLQLTPDENDASKLVLTFECPKEKERNGKIVKFIYNSSADKSDFPNPRKPKGDLTWENDCVFNQTLEVSAETLYTINVYAVTEGNLNGSVSTQTVNISATPPTLTPPTGRKLVEQKGITQREVVLDVCPCLVSKEQGTIILAGIIVCVTTNDDDCNKRRSLQGSRVGNASMYGDRQKFPTWKDFKDKGYKGKYRATPDNWHTIIGEGGTKRRRRSLLKRVARTADVFAKYTLGDNSSCEQAKPDVYCNGPLPAGREIKILVFACTRGGCSEVLALEDLRTEAFADDDNTEAIVGGIVAALAIIALVVVAVFMFRRGDGGHSPLKPRAPRVIPKPIKLKDFTAHLNRLNKDSNLLFQEEFEDVQENSPKQYSHEAATLDVNKIKNRYVNILPYDHTRVKLITDDDDDSSDFINANYIPGYTSPREYIATQGPMTGTIADFWRMMWEQKSSLVVMLSDLQEKGRPKVDMYWPGEMNSPVQYGNIVVELTSDSTLNKYTIRTFKLYVENNPDDSRRVTQYFIPGWEDYSANLSPDDVLDFIGSVRQAARSGQGQGPVCVHCSAGVGRTGTFIALDFLMQFVTEHSLDDEVDIYNLVLNMRHNRPYMVQSEKQYVFIHDTLKLIIDRKIKEMQAQDEHVYGNTQPEDNIYANQAFDPDENLYENTTSMSDKLTTSL